MFDWEEEETQLATPMDAMREYASVVGSEHVDRPWILTDYDVWMAHPYYRGPRVPHPESGEAEDFLESGDFVAAVPNAEGEFDEDNLPVHAMENYDDVPF